MKARYWIAAAAALGLAGTALADAPVKARLQAHVDPLGNRGAECAPAMQHGVLAHEHQAAGRGDDDFARWHGRNLAPAVGTDDEKCL